MSWLSWLSCYSNTTRGSRNWWGSRQQKSQFALCTQGFCFGKSFVLIENHNVNGGIEELTALSRSSNWRHFAHVVPFIRVKKKITWRLVWKIRLRYLATGVSWKPQCQWDREIDNSWVKGSRRQLKTSCPLCAFFRERKLHCQKYLWFFLYDDEWYQMFRTAVNVLLELVLPLWLTKVCIRRLLLWTKWLYKSESGQQI